MPKKDISTGEKMISDTGNWNVASDFAKIKIMVPLAKCEYYEDIATFGYESMIEELMGYNIQNDSIKYTALGRLIKELIKICKNSMFAMKKGNTKADLLIHEKNLDKLRKLVHLTINTKNNNVTKTKEITINERFNEFLDVVLKIKSEINIPLNKNHLIFTDKEEFDPHAYKTSLKDRMTHKG